MYVPPAVNRSSGRNGGCDLLREQRMSGAAWCAKWSISCHADAMDIEGFGIRQAQLFVDRGYIQDLADIYYLPWDEIEALEGTEPSGCKTFRPPLKKARTDRCPGC